jgi:hypothetical protein
METSWLLILYYFNNAWRIVGLEIMKLVIVEFFYPPDTSAILGANILNTQFYLFASTRSNS